MLLVGQIGLMAVPALTLLRVYSIARGLVWLWQHGAQLSDLLKAAPPTTADDRDEIIRQAGGDFFPFGSKAFRLARAARGGRTLRQRAFRVPLRLFLGIWRYPIFMLLLLAYLVTLTHSPLIEVAGLSGTARLSGMAAALIAMIGPILLAVEALVSMAFTGAYATSIHAGSFRTPDTKPKVLTEFQAFVGALFTAHTSAVAAMYFASSRIEEYGKLPASPESLLAGVQRLQDASYYSLFTMLGASDPEPQGPVGKLATGMIGLQGIALLLIVLGATMSPPGRTPAAAPHRVPESQPSPPGEDDRPTVPARRVDDDQQRQGYRVVVAAMAMGALTAIVARHVMSRAVRNRTRRRSSRRPGT